jgi:hypothetical protein
MGAAQQPGSFFQFGWAVFVTPFLLPISFLRDFYQYWATQWRSAPHRVHAPQSGNGRFQGVHSIMMEKSAWLVIVGGGGTSTPLSLWLPSHTKLQCTLQLRGRSQSGNFPFHGVHSIMMEKSALACEDGGCTMYTHPLSF